MPAIPENDLDLNQGPRPHRPLFERVQDWIIKLDLGYGVQWFQLTMFLLFVMTVVLLYTGTQFYGLRDRESMDLGQLGRNLALGRGYVTCNIRPVDLGQLRESGKPVLASDRDVIPELWTPPMYPMILSVWFRMLKPQPNLADIRQQLQVPAQSLPQLGDRLALEALYDAGLKEAMRMDRYLVILAWSFFLIGLGVLYVLGRELFDHRVALMSVVLCLLCDPLLEACIAGSVVPFLSLLLMVLVLALVKAHQWAEAKASIYWVGGALAVAGVVVGMGTLTRYSFVCVLVPVLVFVGRPLGNVRGLVKFPILLGAFLLLVTPWIVRNVVVSGTMFGYSRLSLTEAMPNELGDESAEIQFQRQLETTTHTNWRKMGVRILMNWDRFYRTTVKEAGANYLFAFFLVGLLHRFKREEISRLQWCVAWAALLALLWLGIAGAPNRNPLTAFVPLLAIFGAAFFLVVFERLQFRARWIRRLMVGLFVVLNSLPVVFTLLPPSAPAPYPPYNGGIITAVAETFREGELICTDIPWAVAWYGDRSAVLAPIEEKDYVAINDDYGHVFDGIYLTQQTFMSMRVVDLITGFQRYWVDKFDLTRPVPESFLLKYRRPLTADGGQVLISSRPH